MIKSMMLAVACVSALFIAGCRLKINTNDNAVYYVIQTSEVLYGSLEVVKVSKNKYDLEGEIALAATSDSLKQGDEVSLITVTKRIPLGDNLYMVLAVKQ
jgi:hypothetical protein